MEMIRLHLGEPEQIIGIAGVGPFELDGERAAEVLGADIFKQAVLDLAEDRMSDAAMRLIDYQASMMTGKPS